MKAWRSALWRVERSFEGSRKHPPSRDHLQGGVAQAARARDDVRRRWARRTESAGSLRALASVVGAGQLAWTPLSAPLLARRSLSDCQASCLCRLEKHEHLKLRQLLREIQDREDQRRAVDADRTVNLEELLY